MRLLHLPPDLSVALIIDDDRDPEALLISSRTTVPRGFKRAPQRSESPSSVPTATRTSADSRYACAARSRIEAPSDRGWSSGSTPFPFTVVTTPSETLGEFARLPGSSPGGPAEYQSRSLGASKDLRHGLEAIKEGSRDAAGVAELVAFDPSGLGQHPHMLIAREGLLLPPNPERDVAHSIGPVSLW